MHNRQVDPRMLDAHYLIDLTEFSHNKLTLGGINVSELYDQPKVALSLKTRMVKAEAIEAILYECSTWTLHQKHYAKLCTVHHRVLHHRGTAQETRPSDDLEQPRP